MKINIPAGAPHHWILMEWCEELTIKGAEVVPLRRNRTADRSILTLYMPSDARYNAGRRDLGVLEIRIRGRMAFEAPVAVLMDKHAGIARIASGLALREAIRRYKDLRLRVTLLLADADDLDLRVVGGDGSPVNVVLGGFVAKRCDPR